MFQQVILFGNLTKEPELRTTTSGKSVASAGLATNKAYKNQAGELIKEAEFHNLVVWNGSEAFCKYLHKGSKVLIIGEIKTRSWEKPDGTKAYKTEIIVKEFKFVDSVANSNAPVAEPTVAPVANKAPDTASVSEQVIQTFGGEEISDEEIKIENIPF